MNNKGFILFIVIILALSILAIYKGNDWTASNMPNTPENMAKIEARDDWKFVNTGAGKIGYIDTTTNNEKLFMSTFVSLILIGITAFVIREDKKNDNMD